MSDANRFEDGTTRGGFINNSFGTNIRVADNKSTGSDGGNTGVHFPVDTVSQTEYEYFLFQQESANRVNADSRWNGLSFVDAAFEAVKDKKVVQIFTTGNRDFKNPFHRPLYPYFNPEAERYWIAVAGMQQDSDTYKLVTTWNEAGNAKWWTVAAPGSGIYGSKVNTGSGEAEWGNSSGTSMAAPHVAGALAVLMDRYDQMDALQVRDVMLTTASHAKDGTNYEGWTAKEGEVDERYGWGMPDLEKGMYGPAQLLGKFEYNLRGSSLDVWSNDISEVALNQRKTEDEAWLAAAEKWMKNPTVTLGEGYAEAEKKLLGDMMLETTDDIVGIDNQTISEEDGIAWRKAYYEKRIAAIKARAYDGSVVKLGSGTLVMTGSNTYEGGTTVEDGVLLGFTESFDDKDVVVNGGAFGVLKTYDDQLTLKGELTSTEARKANVVVNAGGSYLFSAGEDVNVGKLVFKEGSAVSIFSGDEAELATMFKDGTKLTGSVTATSIEGDATGDYYAFFDTTITKEGTKLSASMEKRAGGMAAAASTRNDRAIAGAIESAPESDVFNAVIGSSQAQADRTFESLGSDLNFTAQNLAIVNSLSLTRAVKDQATGYGSAATAELGNGIELWATGIGQWSNQDAGGASTDLDADFYAGLIGAEMQVAPSTKLGVFFGAGQTDFKGGAAGKIDADDIHLGVYGETKVGDIAASYGFAYTWQDRDLSRSLVFMDETGPTSESYDADIMQLFGEVAYTGLNTESYAVEPYFGLTWGHAKADGFNEKVGDHAFSSDFDSQNLEVTHIGVRGALPFKAGAVDMKLKGDLAWMHFFGDTEAKGSMRIGDAGVATLRDEELSDMASVGLGIEAKVGGSTTFGFSYTGAFGSDVTSHGIGATVRYAF